jgi:XTP/dITP diphosphohydrolase
MRGIENRAAYFVCCLSLVLDSDRFVVAQETVHGTIVDAPRGVNGFGYDPLFFLPERGVTMAELPEPAKDSVSHRGRAARRILAFLHSDS